MLESPPAAGGGGEAGAAGGAGERRDPRRDPHAAIVAELRARFGDAPAGPAVAIYLAARGYDPAQVAAVLARLAEASAGPGADPSADPGAGVDDSAGSAGSLRSSAAPAPTVQSPVGVAGAAGRPLRAWAPHERSRFTAEAWGRLLRLRAAGLGDHEFEHLVDRALVQLDGPVTLPELRALLGDALGAGDADPPPLH
jgi:hypothetical protein